MTRDSIDDDTQPAPEAGIADQHCTRLTFESVPTEASIVQAFADATDQDIYAVRPVNDEIDLPAIRRLVTNHPETTISFPLRGTQVVVSSQMVAVYPHTEVRR